MENRILQKRVYSDSGSIKIMDEFESINDRYEKIYDTLELQNLFYARYRKRYYSVSLLLQRMPMKKECIHSSLTFTDMKKELLGRIFHVNDKESFKILREVFEGLKNTWNNKENEKLYLFPIPVQFNAQNSSNRSGYGNRYFGEELMHEGTLYGETSNYMFVGAKYELWWK